MRNLDVSKSLCTERGVPAMYLGSSGNPEYPHLIRVIYDHKAYAYNASGVSKNSYLPRIINAWQEAYYKR